jgi:hypothetical protein
MQCESFLIHESQITFCIYVVGSVIGKNLDSSTLATENIVGDLIGLVLKIMPIVTERLKAFPHVKFFFFLI